MRRLYNLEKDLRWNINHIALRVSPADVVEQLEPLHLQLHSNSDDRGLCNLKSLTIILDLPYIVKSPVRQHRIDDEGRVANTIFALKNVEKVIVQNIYYRDKCRFRTESRGQHWILLEEEDESDRINDDR